MPDPSHIAVLVTSARTGSAPAQEALILATQGMVAAVARRVLGNAVDAQDAVQDCYISAFHRLDELAEPAAFPGWLRRIAVTTALDHRRRSRRTWLALDEVAELPVLDDQERRWTPLQRRQLTRALLTLSVEERRWCDRHYHGGWTIDRLAAEAGIDAAAMRKRLQRVRDRLRAEIESDEHQSFGDPTMTIGLPQRIVELLARPCLVDIPENPVGAALDILRGVFAGYALVALPEELDLVEAEHRLGGNAVYIDAREIQRIDGQRVLRYDLSLPLLLAVQGRPAPQRLLAAGKVYRGETECSTHLQAFHQMEVFALDRRENLDAWGFAGKVLESVDRLLPGAETRITATAYPMCLRAWSLYVRDDDAWVEVLAWGEYAAWVLTALGADPERHAAMGAGYGVDRLAALKYRIDDLRKLPALAVGP